MNTHATTNASDDDRRYYECRDCGSRTTNREYRATCPDCGGRVRNIGVQRE